MTIQYKNGSIMFGTGEFEEVKELCPDGDKLRQRFMAEPAGVKFITAARAYFIHKNHCWTCLCGEYKSTEIMEAITLCEIGIGLYLAWYCLLEEKADEASILEAKAAYYQHRCECDKCSKLPGDQA